MNSFKIIKAQSLEDLADQMNTPDNITGRLCSLTPMDDDEDEYGYEWLAVLHWSPGQ